jgi:hypothetical protein
MAITNDNLFSESYNSLKTFLKDNMIDPRNRFKVNWIHPSMPNINESGFDGYPFMVLKIELNEDTKSFDKSTSQKIFRINVGVYSNDVTQVDTISDKIASLFKTKLADFGSKEIASSSMAWSLDEHGKKISFRNVGIICKNRI